MKEKDTSYLQCPVCKAEHSLKGVDIGQAHMMTLPVHVRGVFPNDSNDLHDSMMLAESLSDPETCPCSEQLVPVTRNRP
jgi:hypothetical protein